MTAPHRKRALVAIAAVLVPAAGRAHLVNSGLGPFYDGISHLALTAEDLLPALAVAILAGQRGADAGRTALFALPPAWLAGGLVGLARPGAAAGGAWTFVVPVVLGILIAAEIRLRPAVVAGLAAAVGLLHGYLNGSAMAQARLGLLGLVGIVATVFVAVALVAALVAPIRAMWARIAVRVAGSWAVAVGLLWMGWSMRPR